MNIRQATEADVLVIRELQEQWLAEDNAYGFAPDTPEEIRNALGVYFLVAEIDNRIVGFVYGSAGVSEGLAVVPKGESYFEIDNLYVASQFRRQGVGGLLVDKLLERAKQNGIAHALLYSAVKDIHSILKFYERHNFQSWHVWMFQKL